MRYLIIGWLVFFSLGCSVSAKQPALHDFGLIGAPASRQDSKASVSVNAPTWLWDNRIRYRLLYSAPSQVRFYGLDRWIASPPELLEQLLVNNSIPPDYSLIIRMQDFEQQFDAPERARVILSFSVEAYSGNNQKIGMQEFYLQIPTKTPDAEGAIAGFTELAHMANERIHDWTVKISRYQQ